jgi:ribosome-associated protein
LDEGQNHCDWVHTDAGDVQVHLYRPEVREFNKLEKLWGDAAPRQESRIDRVAL